MRIKKINTTAYRPQGNGANERLHQTLYTLLRNLCTDMGSDWEKKLPFAMYAYRTAHHRIIGMSPYQALFGYAPRQLSLDYDPIMGDTSIDERVEKLQTMHRRLAELVEIIEKHPQATKLPRVYRPDDLVKVKKHVRTKLEGFWDGPYRVVRQLGPVTYEIDFGEYCNRHSVVHATYIRPWYHDTYLRSIAESEESAVTNNPDMSANVDTTRTNPLDTGSNTTGMMTRSKTRALQPLR